LLAKGELVASVFLKKVDFTYEKFFKIFLQIILELNKISGIPPPGCVLPPTK